MANKRSSAAVAAEPSRPSKKRKSAEASKAKIKEIAEAEDIDEAEAFPDEKEKTTIEVKRDDEVEEVQRVVAPGFRLWNTTSKMTAGGELSEASMFDMAIQKYSMLLEIHSEEAFTLKPLVITQGPYKGSRVFMLESGAKFRFFDFPAEIRNLAYSFLVEEDEPIKMSTAKVVNEPRRPVRQSFPNFNHHQGLQRNRKTGKWIDQPPSSFTILRVSKKVFEEVAPLMYGNNRFRFNDLGDLKIFLDRVSSMRKYIRHIQVNSGGWQNSKARSLFTSLREATDLRSLTFHYSTFRSSNPNPGYFWNFRRATTPESLANMLRPMMQLIRHARKEADDESSVLDIVKVEWKKCRICEPLAPEFAEERDCHGSNPIGVGRDVKCKHAAEHCKEIEVEVRKRIAKVLNIEE